MSEDLPDLKGLFAALASFAKAAQGLPGGDEFEYENSFPEFQSALAVTQNTLLDLVQSTISELNEDEDVDKLVVFDDIEDPLLWEECADVCDALIEQVEAYLSLEDGFDGSIVAPLQQWSETARGQSASKLSRMVAATRNDVPKPQDVYNIQTHSQSRTAPFVPAVHPNKPYAISPLDLTMLPGHGYDARYGDLRSAKAIGSVNVNDVRMTAPTQHCPHVYEKEIHSFSYTDKQLQATKPATDSIEVIDPLQFQWIDTEEALQELSESLQSVSELAMDLEAHSHRSFAGIVCLMQVSIRDCKNMGAMKNYLIDTLKLHHCINQHLAGVLANPAIVKVLHGADADVQWLQRDFGMYVVNLFDTGRAARALRYKSVGYAYLLHRYCGIVADKSHQLADWRQRPLALDMQQYAAQDTHYLLDIYERLKWDLEQDSVTSVGDVFDVSRKVCLIRYCPEPFYPDGYRKLLRTRGSTRHELHHPAQVAVLKALWDWRDQIARVVDESLPYVCSNANLLRIALSSRSIGGGSMSVTQLQGLFNPIPPLMLRHSQDIVVLIKRAVQEAENQHQLEVATEEDDDDYNDVEAEVRVKPVGAPSSAFFKPANSEKEQKRRGIMSPVLGTEALYKQAGWMTPLDIAHVRGSERMDTMLVELATTTDDDDDDVEDDKSACVKPKNLLSIHASNHDYQSKHHADNSLELGQESFRVRGRSVDGMGSVRACRSISPTRPNSAPGKAWDTDSLEDEVNGARAKTARIKSDLRFQKDTIPVVLGLIASTGADGEEDEDDGARGDTNEAKEGQGDGAADLEEEFIIPRSIREIYVISNRNRRNKKAGSPTPDRGATPTSEQEREELARAEALLKARGEAVAGYFDDNIYASPGKRPRSRSGRESEDSVPDQSVNVASKEDDLAFMKEIGWIQSKEEVDGILNQRFGRTRGNEAMIAGGSGDGAAEERAGSGYEDSVAPHGIGVINPSQEQAGNNPFFTGAAMQSGGPLAQQGFGQTDQQRGQKKIGAPAKGKTNRSRQQERPEKKDSRTHSYRKR